jgi:tetratricopeptide (TPR) repeat protein
VFRRLLFTLVCALPVLAGVEEDWKELYNLALRAAASKDYPRAEAIYVKALQTAEIFGKADVRVASTLEGQANLLLMENKLAEAEDSARRAVAIYAVSPGSDSLEYAEVELVLARTLVNAGKYQPALQSLQWALPLFESKLGPSAGPTADTICLEGTVNRQLKLYASAEAPLKRCAELRQEEAGVSTPEFAETQNSLALVYQHLGKYKEADRLFAYAAKIREITLGLMSPEHAETLEEYAVLLHQMGRDDDARKKERLAAVIRAHAGKK